MVPWCPAFRCPGQGHRLSPTRSSSYSPGKDHGLARLGPWPGPLAGRGVFYADDTGLLCDPFSPASRSQLIRRAGLPGAGGDGPRASPLGQPSGQAPAAGPARLSRAGGDHCVRQPPSPVLVVPLGTRGFPYTPSSATAVPRSTTSASGLHRAVAPVGVGTELSACASPGAPGEVPAFVKRMAPVYVIFPCCRCPGRRDLVKPRAACRSGEFGDLPPAAAGCHRGQAGPGQGVEGGERPGVGLLLPACALGRLAGL